MKNKRRINIIIKRITVLLLVLAFVFMRYSEVVKADPSDTKERMEKAKQEKEEKKAELEKAKQNLANTQSGLASLESTKNTYEGQLASLNGELTLVADNLAIIETNLDLKRIEVEETTANLEEYQQKCEDQYAAMKERIRFLYESGSNTYLEILLSADSFGEFLNYADYIEDLSAYDRRMLDEYVETQNNIAAQKVILEGELADIETLQQEAKDEQAKVQGLISTTASNIAATADSIDAMEAQEAAYEASCNNKQEELKAAEAEYAAIKAQYEEELRLSRLAAQSAWRDISEITFEEGDRYLLANLIYCEAGAEPYAGKLAVGAVVINRVKSSRYPNTVTGVIYQASQFAPVGDGHLSLALASDKATQECYSAADAAMSGQTNVGNCLYFRTPIEGLTGQSIGGHIFY